MSLGNRLPVLAIGLVVAFTSVIIVANAAESPDSVSKRRLQRKSERRQKTEQFRNETNRAWVRSRAIEGGEGGQTACFESSIVRDGAALRNGRVAFSASAPPPSPGQDIGFTSYDAQAISSQGYNVARGTGGNSRLHFTWMSFKYIPSAPGATDRYVLYSGYDDPAAFPNMNIGTGYNGFEFTSSMSYGGYCGLDVDNHNHAQIAMQQAENDYTLEPYEPWHVQLPFGDDTYQVYGLEGYDNSCPGSGWGRGGVLYPRLTADRSNEVLHEIAHTNIDDCPDHELWYWRFDGISAWSGPALIGNTPDISYVLTADATSNRVAVVTHESDPGSSYTNVAYTQSMTNGTDWLANPTMSPTKTFITNYGPPATQSAWIHLTTTYDNSGNLHIMWDEQENANSEHVAIKHWSNNVPTPRTVALGHWDCPVSTGLYDLNLSKLTMGIGDGSTTCGGGSNNNYVYVTYTQFGGNTPAQLNDYSAEYSFEGRNGGYMNGEIYLAISYTGGYTWSPPVNLTNTKTPGCQPGLADIGTGLPANPDNVCRSEHWATIGRVVKDIDLFFISDLDAGGIPYGEGSWQLNPVHYMQIKGSGIAPSGVCPLIAPVFEATLSADPLCEYHATRLGTGTADLTIMNLGNATLNQGIGAGITVTDFPGLPTLTLTGHALGAYSLPAGDPNINMTATMSSNNAAEGLYLGQISITHNAATEENPSPRIYPVEFFVFDEFFCPQDILLKTGVASPGSLQLQVESSGRFASQHEVGGLWRFFDSSSSIFDGSLLIAHGIQGPADTTVYLRFGNRNSNGQYGFEAQSDLFVDTSAYGWGPGDYAYAHAEMCTADSVVGIGVDWYFPQNASSDEVVLVKYTISPHGTTPISNLMLGALIDFDVVPAQRRPLDTMQIGNHNHGLNDGARNLSYVRGTNKPGSMPSGPNTAERFRAGVATPCAVGMYTGNSDRDILPGGGPTDQHLYQLLQSVSGVEVGEAADTDLYVLVGFGQGLSVPVGTVLTYGLILVSDTVSDASFKTKVDDGLALAASLGLCSPPSSPPHIVLYPSTLNFNAVRNGALPPIQSFTITNSGAGTLSWGASDDAAWLVENPISGASNNQSVTVSVNTTNLSLGSHPATITVSSTNANNSPQTIAVNYSVLSDTLTTPHISLSQSALNFNARENGALPGNQSFAITNVGGGTLNWNVSGNATWLVENPTSDVSNNESITVSVNTTNLSAGPHPATITVSSSNADNSPQSIAVNYSVVADSVSSAGLVARWGFNEGTGGVVYDVSGHGNHATLVNNPTWTAGYSGGALDFDGVNDYVYAPDSPSLDIQTSTMTFAAWVQSPGFQDLGWIIGKGQAGSWDDMVWWLLPKANGAVRYAIKSSGSTVERWDIPVGLRTNEWIHVAVTYDGVTMSFYLDGEVKDSWPKIGNMNTNNSPVYMGLNGWNTSNHYRGKIDEVYIYGRALSVAELRQLSGLCGDLNHDGVRNVLDIVALIGVCFRNAPPPNPGWCGDLNGDGAYDIVDVVTMVGHAFRNGPVPRCLP